MRKILNQKTREGDEATQILTNLGVLQEIRSQGIMSSWALKSTFKKNLFLGIFKNDSAANRSTEEAEHSIDQKMIEKLDAYSLERWEVLLHFEQGSIRQKYCIFQSNFLQ